MINTLVLSSSILVRFYVSLVALIRCCPGGGSLKVKKIIAARKANVTMNGTGSLKYATVGANAQKVTEVVNIKTREDASDSGGTLSSMRIIVVVIIPPIEKTMKK